MNVSNISTYKFSRHPHISVPPMIHTAGYGSLCNISRLTLKVRHKQGILLGQHCDIVRRHHCPRTPSVGSVAPGRRGAVERCGQGTATMPRLRTSAA